MKILARRLQLVVEDIVGTHQTCGIKGRSITTNVHVARCILDCCDKMDQAVSMLQIEFQIAVDKVSHEIFMKILEHVNVGRIITEGVRMAYKECSASIILNKSVSAPIKVRRLVRQ